MVEIISHIELNENERWMIRVVDTTDNEGYICDNIDEYSYAIAKMGEKYDNQIQINWSKDPDVTPKHFHEIELQMRLMQQNLDS